MGQYFIIYNLTRRQSVKPAFANWKWGEWDWVEVIKIMGWKDSDELRAYGDSGTVYGYCNGKTTSSHQEEEKTQSDDEKTQPYERKYICNIRGTVLDQPYDYEEYCKLIDDNKIVFHFF